LVLLTATALFVVRRGAFLFAGFLAGDFFFEAAFRRVVFLTKRPSYVTITAPWKALQSWLMVCELHTCRKNGIYRMMSTEKTDAIDIFPIIHH